MTSIFRPKMNASARNFGFIRTTSRARTLYMRLFGAPHVMKRLQALDIMYSLDLRGVERVLDFGCGRGALIPAPGASISGDTSAEQEPRHCDLRGLLSPSPRGVRDGAGPLLVSIRACEGSQ